MMRERFSKREQALITVTVLVIAIVVAYGFIIEPLSKVFNRLNREIKVSRLKLEKSMKLLERQDEIEADYNKYALLLKPSTSEEEEIASMLQAIEAVASKDSIQITNIRPLPARDRGYYQELSFEVIAESPLEGLIKFMYDLQAADDLLRVVKFTLTAKSSSGNNLKAILSISKPAVAAN
ncbi:MAG: type 4a pilus biogenesis protein PilO [Candidatus Omnitrophica bacterium]|nr:type 4a pilus biogenesis protein PilO [Candidatus Omnitrophota bacterium]